MVNDIEERVECIDSILKYSEYLIKNNKKRKKYIKVLNKLKKRLLNNDIHDI